MPKQKRSTQFSVHNIFRIFFKIYTIIYISLVDDKAAAKAAASIDIAPRGF
jgi:hypothetical protein